MDVDNEDIICLAQFLFPGETEWKAAANIMQTASDALRICRVKYEEDDYSQDVLMQIHKDRTVMTGLMEEDSFSSYLKEPGEMKRACRYLFNCFEEEEDCSPPVPALLLSRGRYEGITEKFRSCSLCALTEYLGAATGDTGWSIELAKALKDRTCTGELRLCSRDSSGWRIQQASFIEAASGGWLLRMSCEPEQDFLVALPFTKGEMCCAFYEWIMQPAPVSTPE